MAKRRSDGNRIVKAGPADNLPAGAKLVPIDIKTLTRIARSAAREAVRNRPPEPRERTTANTQIETISNADWLGPGQPVPPQAPTDASPIRTWDYPIAYNVEFRARKYTPYSAAQLRWLAYNFDLLAEVISRRQDEIASIPWDIVDRKGKHIEGDAGRDSIVEFLRKPDRVHPFPIWQRMVLEDMYVIDGTTIYPWPTLDGSVYSLDPVDGGQIMPLIDDSGRLPDPPNPAYCQIIKGIPYNFFTKQELIYFPRNLRTISPLYGYSQVEQCVMTIIIGINAEMRHNFFYSQGTIPDSLVTVPDKWTPQQIASFQAWFDGLMRGNLRKRAGGLVFLPGGMRDIAVKDYSFTADMWEWVARVICAHFHVSPQPYVKEQNRATAQTAQVMQVEEGLEPDKEWFAALMNVIVAEYFKRPDLRFQFQDSDRVDIVEQAKADDLNVRNGTRTITEIRIERGHDPYANGLGDEPIFNTPNGPMPLEEAFLATAPSVAPPAAPAAPAAKPGAEPAKAESQTGGKESKPEAKPAVEAQTEKASAISKIIRHEADGWHLYSEDGQKHLGGPYPNKDALAERIAEVEGHKDNGASKVFAEISDGVPRRFVKVGGVRYIELDGWLVPENVL